MSPKEAIWALADKVRGWISSQGHDDLAQIDQALAARAAEAAQSVGREDADVASAARDFADARSEQLELSSHDLMSGVLLSNSGDIETIWADIKRAPSSGESNYFERLGQSEKRYTIAKQLHDAGDAVTATTGPLKAAAAIEYEALCCGTQRLSDAYASEADRILALEGQGHWGGIREIANRAVTMNALNFDRSNLVAARAAVSNWKKYSAKLSVAAARDGMSAQTLQPDQWNEWFADYLTKHPDMAGLWGYIVIDTTDGDSTWEPYYQERIREANSSSVEDLPIGKYKTGLNIRSDYDSLTADIKNGKFKWLADGAATKAAEAKIREHGPYPRDGYRYFMSQMHVQSDTEANAYYSSEKVGKYVGWFCPVTQRGH